jgi:hypothetical protein
VDESRPNPVSPPGAEDADNHRQGLSHEVRRDGQRDPALRAQIEEIIAHCANLPVLDPRTDDEIIGYDEHGIPQ